MKKEDGTKTQKKMSSQIISYSCNKKLYHAVTQIKSREHRQRCCSSHTQAKEGSTLEATHLTKREVAIYGKY